MKTPDVIKRAMEGCHTFEHCSECPYFSLSVTLGCKRRRNADALAYIQQLEADNAKKDETIQVLQSGNASLIRMIDEECEKIVALELERGAALYDMHSFQGATCAYCKNLYRPDGADHNACREFGDFFGDKEFNPLTCGKFKWRGVCAENTGGDPYAPVY